ncbi:MAG: AI-2E family transporter [Anaerolineales bacterium]
MNRNTQWSLPFRYAVGFMIFVAIIAFIIYARDAVRNLVIAAFVAYLISPIVESLSVRTRMSRKASVNVVYFSALILLVGVPATLTPIFYDEVQIVIQDILDLSKKLGDLLSNPVHLGNLTFHLENWGKNLTQLQGEFLAPLPEEALKLLETTSVSALWFLVILVSVYLFLSEWPRIRAAIFDWVLPPYHDELQELYKRIRNVWMAYLRGQIVLMVIVGVVFTVVWVIMGIPGALVLGVIAGLFTLVPDVGPAIAVALAAGVALLEGSSWIHFSDSEGLNNLFVAGLVIAVYLVLINLKNFFLRPYIMGRSVHMHEGLVFIAIVIATILEGILGALLVVPLLASVVLIAGYIQRKVLGLPPFEDDGSTQFTAPPELVNPPRRSIRRKKAAALDEVPASISPVVDPPTLNESQPKTIPARKKANK